MKRFSYFSKPYLVWMFVLVALPLAAMIILSFMKTSGVNLEGASFTFENFARLSNPAVIVGFYNSLKFAFIATILSLLIGYPVAYIVSKSKIKNKFLVLAAIILPMWSNKLLRTVAIGYALSENNVLRSFVNTIGIDFVLNIKGTDLAIIIGLISSYLPFMILPIYTILEKIDHSLLEASKDLGANGFWTFWKVIFPISLKGVATGIIMVFLPSATGFVVPYVLGNGNYVLIGTVIEDSFKIGMDYNFGSLLSLILIIVILGALFIISKVDKEGETLL